MKLPQVTAIIVLVAVLAFLAGRSSMHREPSLPVAITIQDVHPTNSTTAIVGRLQEQVQRKAATDALPPSARPGWRFDFRNQGRVDTRMAENVAEYTAFLDGLGMSPEQIDHTLQNLGRIFDLAIITGDSRAEMIQSRKGLDDFLKKTLSPEQYQDFLTHEQSKYTAREMTQMQEFASKKGVTIDPEVSALVEKAVHAAKAYSTESWGGPYDPLPHPTSGIEMGEDARQNLARLQATVDRLLPELQGRVPDAVFQGITEYYQSMANSYQKTIDFAFAPPERQKEIMEQIMIEAQKARRSGTAARAKP